MKYFKICGPRKTFNINNTKDIEFFNKQPRYSEKFLPLG